MYYVCECELEEALTHKMRHICHAKMSMSHKLKLLTNWLHFRCHSLCLWAVHNFQAEPITVSSLKLFFLSISDSPSVSVYSNIHTHTKWVADRKKITGSEIGQSLRTTSVSWKYIMWYDVVYKVGNVDSGKKLILIHNCFGEFHHIIQFI